ncbi:MAG: DEAD/DEAH box helicase family protein [Candidatus Nanopelagicales bacterium]
MQVTLKDYQTDALAGVLTNLSKGGRRWHEDDERSAFSLSAVTGAGKTVIAAAAIEALFKGDDDNDFQADPSAVVLWFSSDPSLNEQTRFRLLDACDRIGHSDLVVVGSTFNAEKFSPGKVYFLNTQKLSKKSLLVRGHEDPDPNTSPLPGMEATRPDLRGYTIWDTIQNTIEDPNLTLYLVLDEAHRGLGKSKTDDEDKDTIVSRLINGHGSVPGIPVVWGISATVARFDAAMKAAAATSNRTTLPSVEVDPDRVQASGLLKDDIVLDIPAESGQFDTVLLKRATRKVMAATKDWQDYAEEQGVTEPVAPLLVLQSPNKPSDESLKRALDTIAEEWPEITSEHVAHVFGEHDTKTFGGWNVPYISPELVEESTHIRVLLAKDAISTGWDCPRAEVLVSFRPAKDETHITQLLGRMVRTPLARRIPGNDRLNSVDCILPNFDRKTATKVVNLLMSTSENGDDRGGGTGGGRGRRVLIDPQDMTPNSAVEEAVLECFEQLPTESLPKKAAKPVKRLTALAQALATDGLKPDAGKEAHKELHAVLDGLSVRYQDQVKEAVADVETADGEAIQGTRGGTITYSPFSETADDRTIEDAYRAAGRAFTPDLTRTYAEHLAPDEEDDDALRDAHVKIAALALVPEIKEALDREADALAKKWFNEQRVAIKGLSDDRQSLYNEIQAMSTEPQRIQLTRPLLRQEETKHRDNAGAETDLPTRPQHLLSDEEGNYPIGGLNQWETSVLDRELAFPNASGWYRNPARVSDDSLAITYQDASGGWKTMRPDFIFFNTQEDGSVVASIIDPHGHHLSDAVPKLRGLANYADTYGSELHRVEAIAEVDGTLRVLDLKKDSVRKAVASAKDAKTLYSSDLAADY